MVSINSAAGNWPALGANSRHETAIWPVVIGGQLITLSQGGTRIVINAIRHGRCDG
jgi:hypothetical protein